MKQNYCGICGSNVCRNSKKCKSCAQKGKKHPNRRKSLRRRDVKNEDIKRLYIKENKTVRQIAELFGCGAGTISRRVVGMGLPINRKMRIGHKKYHCNDCGKKLRDKRAKRCIFCENKSRKGINSPVFRTGSSRLYYKRIARENLRQECFKCKVTKSLCVHHIDKNRDNNNINNLRMLCRSCHSKEHKLENNLGSRTKLKDLSIQISNLIKKYEKCYKITFSVSTKVVLDDLKSLNKLKRAK